MKKLKVKYLDSYSGPKKIEMPRDGDVGIDIYSAESVYASAGKVVLISTGVSMQLPDGYWLQIVDRSSVSKYAHIMAGIVDTGYTGELKVRCLFHSGVDMSIPAICKIERGVKIAQLIIRKNYNKEFLVEEVEELVSTERGDAGFGSTGGM